MSTNRAIQSLLTIGSRLLAERTRLELSQQQMADYGGVSRQSYRLYEEGRREPSLSFILTLSTHGPDFVYLVFGESKRKHRGTPICLSEEALGAIFSNTSQLIRAEFNDELPESERRALFVKMCKLVAESDSAAIDVAAIAHEVKLT